MASFVDMMMVVVVVVVVVMMMKMMRSCVLWQDYNFVISTVSLLLPLYFLARL
jgi:hypothetical protein